MSSRSLSGSETGSMPHAFDQSAELDGETPLGQPSDDDPFAAHRLEREDSMGAHSSTERLASEGRRQMHGASCSSPEASVSPMPSEDDSAEGRQDGSTEGSGEDSQSGEDSGQMSAAMNLKEYEARFVHRRRERPKHGSVDSSFQSSGPQDRSASTEESIDFGDGESYGATQEEHSHAAAARVASGDDATLLDPNTGRSMTEAEAIAKIRAEIAAAQAQAQAASEIASAQALARATAAETYSELGSQYADDSGDDGGMTTSSMIMEVADVPNVGPPHRDAEREQTEAQKSTGSSYEDIGKDKSATKDKTQSAGLSRGSAGDEEIDRGLQALVDDGAELMNALPEPNYHQISADLLKSSSPVAVAVRRHQYQLQQGLSATSADFQVKLQAELASAGAIVLPKTTLVAHGDAAQFAGETEKQRDRRLMMERLQKRGRPSVEDLAEGALGGTVKALNLGQPNPDQHSGREPSNPLAAMRAERRASYSEQDDMFPTFTRSRSSGTNSSATFRRVHSTPMSGTAQAGMGISRAPSDVGEMRQFRSLQTRQHISDIHKRIRDMQQHMKDALLDDSMSIATHIRVFQKFDVVAEILHTLGRQMSANKNLPLVLRDKHDESMRLASIECLSIVKESGVEAYTILKQLHDSLVEAQSWLNNIEDEVVRIAEGTVILATSDASELQPVFEQLYIRWQVENSAAGRAFRAWFIIKTDRKAQRDRLVIENVVRRLQQARVVCIRGLFSAWAGARTHRKKTEKIKKTSKFHLLLSAKVWAVNSWKITTVHHKASRRLARKLLRKLQTRSFCSWARLAVEVQEAEVRRQKAEKLAFKKLGRQALYAWFHTILRRNKLKSKLRAAEDVNKVMMCTRAFNAWNALQRRNKYHRQEVSRRLKDRLERDFKEWRLIARILKTQRKRALFLSIRLTNGLKDRTFQLWCESIEDEIIKKMRVDKFISQNRIFWLSSSFRKWAWCAHLTERGVGHFKVRRLFKSLKRYIKLLKEQRRIFDKWSDTNDEIRLHQRFAGWQDYITKLRLGMAKLRAICEEQGGLDEQMCFDRWRAKESKCRLWRYQRRHLQKRQNTNLRIKFWKLWLLNALGKEDLDKAARHAIRMGHTRLRHHTICTAFRVLSSYLTYMLAKKRKILQVAVCNQRRKMQLAWSVWVRLLVASRAFAALQARHIVRFKRRHLKLFSKNVKHRVSRMLFGAWCGECKRPFDRKELQDYTQNPDEVEIRLNENERGIVAAKRQRHHIHHLLQRAKESWSDCSEDEKISTRNHEQMEQAGLLAQYLREIDEAKVMMGQKSDLQDQSQDSRRSDERVKIGTRPLQRRRASREREQMHSAWSKLRNELLSTQRDLQTEGETRERAERSADSNVNFSKELESAAGQRQRWINQKDDNEHGWDQENMAPYNPRELRHRVLEALELAKCELATPLYEGARFDRGELPLLNVPSTHGFEHEVVADKKTAATSTYQLWNEHHLPHAQFVQNWGRQLRNDQPLSSVMEQKAPRPPSAAKPSHLVGVGLGFNPQYRVKRREIDPRLDKSPYSTAGQTLPDAEKASAIRIARQKAVSAPAPSRYHLDELAEYMAAVGGATHGSDKDKQIDRLRNALQHEYVP